MLPQTTQPTYDTNLIIAYMKTAHADYVTGYQELDIEALLEDTLAELRDRTDTSIPETFLVALNAVAR